MYGRPVGLIVAEPSEMIPLKEAMEQVEERCIGSRTFHIGTLGKVRAVVVLSGIGRCNSAATAAMLCTLFNPEFVINSGTAGGLSVDLEIGDVVLATETVYGDVDNRCFNYQFGQVPKESPRFHVCQKLLANQSAIYKNQGIKTHCGLVVTVESFCHTADAKAHLLERFKEALVVEMEGCAIGQICTQFAIPFIVIRCVSDTAISSIEYEEFSVAAGRKSAQATIALLRNCQTVPVDSYF